MFIGVYMFIQYCNLLRMSINALKRMLSVIFELRIDWYTNKGQCNNTVNEMIYSGIPIRSPVGQYRYCTQNEFVND